MPSDDAKRFRERLKELRNSKGLSQEDLEQLIGAQKNYITRVETGRILPPLDAISRIARKLEVPIEELFFFDGMDDSAEELRKRIAKCIQTSDLGRLRKYYRLMLLLDEERR